MSIDQDIANSAKQLDIDVRINHQITNGDENTEVATEGGPVPSIRKRLKDIESEWAKTADPLANDLAQSVQLTKEYQDKAAVSSFTAAEQADRSKQAADASANHANTASESSNEAIISAKLAAEELPKVIAEGASQVKAILDEGQRQVGLVINTGAQQTVNVKAYADKAKDAQIVAEQAANNSATSAENAAGSVTKAAQEANCASTEANRAELASQSSFDSAGDSAASASSSASSATLASTHKTSAEQAQTKSEAAAAKSELAKNCSEVAASQSENYSISSGQHAAAAMNSQNAAKVSETAAAKSASDSFTHSQASAGSVTDSQASAKTSAVEAAKAQQCVVNATAQADRAEAASAGSLKKTENLSDITDKLISRINLDVYSKSETDDLLGNLELLPDQAGSAGKLLGTDGATANWVNPSVALPYQVGHGGKFLQTDGMVATWQITPVVNPNLLINGDLSVCQRGTVFDFPGYTADMWYVDNLITGHLDLSVDPIIVSELTFGFQCSSWVNGIRQILRLKMYGLSGKKVTAHAIVSGPQGKTTKISIDDIGESPPFTFTGQSQHISHTFTVTDDISVLPTDVIIRFHKDCTASPNEIVYLSDMKLEIGDVPTIFTPYEYISNLLNCQRYYYQLDYGDYLGVGSGQSGNLRYIYHHPTEMELIPVVTVEGNVMTKLGGAGTNTSSTPMSVDFVNQKCMSITTVNGYRADFTAPYGMVEGTVKVSAEP